MILGLVADWIHYFIWAESSRDIVIFSSFCLVMRGLALSTRLILSFLVINFVSMIFFGDCFESILSPLQ